MRSETLQGKGHVVRRMFADIEADAYVLVDGDDTYDAEAAPGMVWILVDQQLDMVTGIRADIGDNAYRLGHYLGNKVLTELVRWIFGKRVTDVLSGYRVFSRRFVKSFPALATGFETETEFTVHALELRMPIAEISTKYRSRPIGSVSKLRTFSDGLRILAMIVRYSFVGSNICRICTIRNRSTFAYCGAINWLGIVGLSFFGVRVDSGLRRPWKKGGKAIGLLGCAIDHRFSGGQRRPNRSA